MTSGSGAPTPAIDIWRHAKVVSGNRNYANTDRYAVHYRYGWEAIGQDETMPKMTRLVAFAYAHTDSNGHAQFKRGELMKLLSDTKQGVQKLIKRAVRDGWLIAGSCSECLVAPPHVSDRRYISASCAIHPLRAGVEKLAGPVLCQVV